jgi:hypothetical protein
MVLVLGKVKVQRLIPEIKINLTNSFSNSGHEGIKSQCRLLNEFRLIFYR